MRCAVVYGTSKMRVTNVNGLSVTVVDVDTITSNSKLDAAVENRSSLQAIRSCVALARAVPPVPVVVTV